MLAEHANKRYDMYCLWKQCVAESNEERSERGGGFFAGSASGKCARQLAFGYLNKPRTRPIPEHALRRFEHGGWFEDYVRYKIRNCGLDGITLDCVELQVKIDNPPIIAHIDGRVQCDTVDNLIAIINHQPVAINREKLAWHHLECKTSQDGALPTKNWAGYGFQAAKELGVWVSNPDYEAQAQVSLHALQDMGIMDTWFVIEDKDNNFIMGQTMPYNPARYEEVANRIKLIHEVVLNGGLPENELDKSKFPCYWKNKLGEENFCDYWDYCYKE